MPTFTPQTWQPLPAPPLTGEFEKNDALAEAALWKVGGEGPEDVVVGSDGTAYAGTADGSIVAATESGNVRQVADVGGRPLGIEWYGEDLVVCNPTIGLQRVSMSGAVDTLVDSVDGQPLLMTNNASVAADGTIYFSDSSTRWGFDTYVNDLVEGQSTGRVFALAPDGVITQIGEGLQFANGVALDPAEESLFVAETGKYRVYRHWLAGDRDGETELFLDNLPGFPDNLSVGSGTLWVAMVSPRQAVIDFMAPRSWMKTLTYRLPDALKPKPVRHGMVFGYDMDGRITHNYQDTTDRVAITTTARLHENRLFIGSLHDEHIAVVDLP
jgi:sugar lactone lactonase YvrE